MTSNSNPSRLAAVRLPGEALLAAVLVVSAVGAGCSSLSVSRDMAVPPKVEALHGRRQVFVNQFSGGHGLLARNLVLKAIADAGYNPLKSREDGDVVVLGGNVTPEEWGDETKEMIDRRCAKRNKKGKCTRYVKVKVYTRTQVCALGVKVTAVDKSSGQIVFQTDARGAEARIGSYDEGKKRTPDLRGPLCEVAVREAVEDATERLIATEDDFDLDFHPIENDKGSTEQAVAMVEQDRLEDAERLLAPLSTSTDLSADERDWSQYNLALVYFAGERFDDCIDVLDGMKHAPRSTREVSRLRQTCIKFR